MRYNYDSLLNLVFVIKTSHTEAALICKGFLGVTLEKKYLKWYERKLCILQSVERCSPRGTFRDLYIHMYIK